MMDGQTPHSYTAFICPIQVTDAHLAEVLITPSVSAPASPPPASGATEAVYVCHLFVEGFPATVIYIVDAGHSIYMT